MCLFRKLSFFLFMLIAPTVFLAAQPANSTIDSLIHLITPESYSSHFKHFRTDSTSSRKVIKKLIQSNDHDGCRNYILRNFENYFGCDNTYIHNFSIDEHGWLSNVIAYKEGRCPWKGIIVVSAHYDSNNSMGEPNDDDDPSPGANDNGTGLSAMLEIARILSSVSTERSILFTAWDIEELMYNGYPAGSNEWYTEYVASATATDWMNIGKGGTIIKKDITANVNFDMFGNPQDTVSGKPLLWVCTGSYAHNKFAKEYIDVFSKYVSDISLTHRGVMIYSDHYSFASRGVPAVLNLESEYEKDPFYHTKKDHLLNSDNVDIDFALKVARGGFAYILHKAGVMLPEKKYIDLPGSCIYVSDDGNKYILEADFKPDTVDVYRFSGKKDKIIKEGNRYLFSPKKSGGYFIYMSNTDTISTKKVILDK